VALDGARNAGILAAQIIGASDAEVGKRLDAFKESLKDKVAVMNQELKNQLGN
jgi:5-(carboxyamino)imidazole ribonucleotide mutase